MSKHKTPDPMWTAEKLHAVIEKIYSEYAPLCKTELGLMFARDIATLTALQFQLTEAFGVARHTDESAVKLAKDVFDQHRIQISSLSRRLEKLEQRQNPL